MHSETQHHVPPRWSRSRSSEADPATVYRDRQGGTADYRMGGVLSWDFVAMRWIEAVRSTVKTFLNRAQTIPSPAKVLKEVRNKSKPDDKEV